MIFIAFSLTIFRCLKAILLYHENKNLALIANIVIRAIARGVFRLAHVNLVLIILNLIELIYLNSLAFVLVILNLFRIKTVIVFSVPVIVFSVNLIYLTALNVILPRIKLDLVNKTF